MLYEVLSLIVLSDLHEAKLCLFKLTWENRSVLELLNLIVVTLIPLVMKPNTTPHLKALSGQGHYSTFT